MKNIVFLLVLVFGLQIANAQYVTIPDSNFRAYLIQKYPQCFNNQSLLDTNCFSIVHTNSLDVERLNISSIEGIQYFKGLQEFWCDHNQITSIPSLPQSLTYLDCSENQIINLPPLPDQLEEIACLSNQLIKLPSLPNTLKALYCSYNQIDSLPTLPSQLLQLGVSYNKLQQLPLLPGTLRYLACEFNELTSLPVLPTTMIYILCQNNLLTTLPVLPDFLDEFDCSDNMLTTMPSLPLNLINLACDNNLLSSLPALPSSLNLIRCRDNPINCLPLLPYALQYAFISNTNIACRPNEINNAAFFDTILPICTNPSDICDDIVNSIENNNKLVFKLFPNPASEKIKVVLPEIGKVKWVLSDISGKIIKQGTISNNMNTFEIGVNDIANGTYLFSLEMNEDISTSKIIILR